MLDEMAFLDYIYPLPPTPPPPQRHPYVAINLCGFKTGIPGNFPEKFPNSFVYFSPKCMFWGYRLFNSQPAIC